VEHSPLIDVDVGVLDGGVVCVMPLTTITIGGGAVVTMW
jgi:hypothetical protein